MRRLACAWALWLAWAPANAMSFLPGLAVPWPETGPTPAALDAGVVDAVLVKKSQRRLYLMHGGRPVRTYRISLGTAPVGHKERRGDNRTPEGHYVLDWRNPRSRFTRSLHISYPNAADRANAQRNGWDPGGMIMIHGQPRAGANAALQDAVRDTDWTEGCIAVSNPAIMEIWRATPNGTPIEIRP
ncbi:MAG: L,D-transpeptidase family protein [Thiohalocapsa sp.]|nr:L,D-transpeptidase family protein [Thiohalocapsa sp.]